MRGVYRFAASSTRIATTVIATPSTPTITSANPLIRSAASGASASASGERAAPWSSHQGAAYNAALVASNATRKATMTGLR
jgi:hypothetical protein